MSRFLLIFPSKMTRFLAKMSIVGMVCCQHCTKGVKILEFSDKIEKIWSKNHSFRFQNLILSSKNYFCLEMSRFLTILLNFSSKMTRFLVKMSILGVVCCQHWTIGVKILELKQQVLITGFKFVSSLIFHFW